jgi:TolB-like protein/DNA-binding winged helix-turn-helix (wHTH) protein/Flp pilus assembly protein TadD
MTERGTKQVVRFGSFEISTDSGVLRKNGARITISGQAIQVLLILLENRERVVTREELQKRLWPGASFGDFEHGLNAAVNRLREVLGDSATEPKYIETVPRRGYRFIGSVEGTSHTSAAAAEEKIAPSPAQFWRTEENPRSAGLYSAVLGRWPKWVVVGGVGLPALVVLVVASFFLAHQRRETAPPRIESLAVLPFVNLSGDPEQEYFADGMTDELIVTLGQIHALRVISRTSVMKYKGAALRGGIREIAQQLSVDGVVEGSVLRSGNRVRITAQLIQASDDRHLWAESYERKLLDVLALQEEVARTIADQIKVRLTPQEQAHLSNGRTVDPEAHELYLKGRFFWDKRSEEGLKKSIEYFQEAIEKEPTYASAYSGLADSYNMLGLFGDVSQMESSPKAKAAATKALEIDDQLAEAHASLAWNKFAFDWDWPGAEREFRRAIELNPSYATSYRWFANCLTQQGRHEVALAEIKQAQQLDPLSLVTNIAVAYTLYMARHYDESIQQSRKTLELDNQFAPTHWILGLALEQDGEIGEAIAEFQKATTLDAHPFYPAALGHAYGVAGKRDEAQAVLAELAKLSIQKDIAWNDIALIYAGLGDKEKALAALDTAYHRHDSQSNWLKVDPRFDVLRSEPRFQDLLHRMNLPPP